VPPSDWFPPRVSLSSQPSASPTLVPPNPLEVLEQDFGLDELEEGEVRPTPDNEEDRPTLDELIPDWFVKKSIVTDVDVSSDKHALTSLIVQINQAASNLRRLPPLRLWRGNQRRAWARCTRQFTHYFRAALRQDSNSEDFLKLCLRLLELPSIILTETMPVKKPPSDARASLPFKLKRAESLVFQDRLHEATKIMFSHGVTPPSEEVLVRSLSLTGSEVG
jgi:hypothetical protein